ncbi:transcriptional regulator [Snodgrassella alvi]|uniref:YdaS family helix-turn-helix protein n=1 Tax=Snodgrassella alvi TaxID=1196083 RepID=A0ABD7Z306_9NEIS|nr:YdaS family helix-turn-helix protein [Snodgrassella alvi]PIT44505.1 hypothetical protein BHC45_06400 [Snodgrassella alvi]UOO97720.1 helix-turn-helix domain-containing protein [Snodgrassella alvi wkB2]WLS98336.1 YdaS family helix-turn-helix protein [Snodgrassella alvi]
MELKSYLSQERGRSTNMARALNTSPGFITMIANGRKAVPPQKAVAIEQYTNGIVTRKNLRPLDYAKFWPELAD